MEYDITFSQRPECYILKLTPEDRAIFSRWDYSPQFESYYWHAAADAERYAE